MVKGFQLINSLLATCIALAFAVCLELIVFLVFNFLGLFSVDLIVLHPVQSILYSTGLERLHHHLRRYLSPSFMHPLKDKIS